MSDWYCDGSTYKNGQPGQDSSCLVFYPDGKVERSHIGDVSNNYAESWAIFLAACSANNGDTIFTDSTTSYNWIYKSKKPKYDFILETIKLLGFKKIKVALIRRDKNKAGIEIERCPFY